MAIKNFWSLNVDEAIVAEKLKNKLSKKGHEVFFPLNSQLKDIDLVLINLENMKIKTLQVKGSRTYQPKQIELKELGPGSSSWFVIHRDKIFNTNIKVDYFIFVIYSLSMTSTKKKVIDNYVIVPIKDLQELLNKKKVRPDKRYHLFLWVTEDCIECFDIEEGRNKDKRIHFTDYLNKWDLLTNS